MIEEFQYSIDDLSFSKTTLIELKKWLKKCKKNENYNKLLLSEALLCSTISINEIIEEKMANIIKTQHYALNNIKYIPADIIDYDINKLKCSIEVGMQKLKK